MQRDNFFVNYKALLILLVVIGHFTGPFRNESYFFEFLVISIYCFHMPAFVFITGYFSRKNDLLRLVKSLLIPYLLFQVLYYLMNYFFDRNSDFSLLTPNFSLWYLLSLFCWRIMIDKAVKIKGILFLSIAAGVLVGFITGIGAYGTVERTITFFPFFIMGHMFNKDKFIKYAEKLPVKIVSALLLCLLFTYLYFSCESINFNVLLMKYSYEKQDVLQLGWLYRLLVYLFATLFTFLIAVIIPRKKHCYTYIGQRTMSIYLFHGIVYKIAQYGFHMDRYINETGGMLLILLCAVFLTYILSLKPFDYIIKKISSLPLENLFRLN
jgi:fucose 4-O-acetylase-like acetyltransferase